MSGNSLSRNNSTSGSMSSMSSGGSSSHALLPPPAQSPLLPPTSATSNRRSNTQKKHQRILWDSDAATRDGKTSIGILLEWLARPGNYDRWRDGKTQFGETREALCSQIKAEMITHGIGHRENANIRTQMSELERAYDNAVALLTQSGYHGHLPDNADSIDTGGSGSLEAQVLRTCRYFHILDPIMRRSTTPAAAVPSATSTQLSPGRDRAPRPRGSSAAARSKTRARAASGDDSDGSRGGREDRNAYIKSSSNESIESVTVADLERTHSLNERSMVLSDLDDHAAMQQHRHVQSLKRKASDNDLRRTDSNNSNNSATSTGTSHAVPSLAVAQLDPFTLAPLSTTTATTPAQSDAWLAAAGNATANATTTTRDSATQQRVLLDAARDERDRRRLSMEEQRNRLECAKLELEIQTAQLRLRVERALARKTLAAADVSDAEIAAVVAL